MDGLIQAIYEIRDAISTPSTMGVITSVVLAIISGMMAALTAIFAIIYSISRKNKNTANFIRKSIKLEIGVISNLIKKKIDMTKGQDYRIIPEFSRMELIILIYKTNCAQISLLRESESISISHFYANLMSLGGIAGTSPYNYSLESLNCIVELADRALQTMEN